ncbi:hypothetical protein [Streptomyces sp. DH8]|uniref:hypothetical protein n=1 Tax=Streptomyces sp. DH8 TaxID=2857008 RepID=UPI001E363FE1|nr:hypothetical protein [Streptomyces sp. DH8]
MATRTFALNTEPHIATVGSVDLGFQPEVMGDDFMDGYMALRDAQRGAGVDVENLEDADPSVLRGVTNALRSFLADLMVEDSAKLFLSADVVQAREVVGTYATWAEAEAAAADLDGASARWTLRLPDRVIVELMEWVVELYSGGSRPTTSSSGSSRPPSRAGRRGTGVSPSRVSTPTSGR